MRSEERKRRGKREASGITTTILNTPSSEAVKPVISSSKASSEASGITTTTLNTPSSEAVKLVISSSKASSMFSTIWIVLYTYELYVYTHIRIHTHL